MRHVALYVAEMAWTISVKGIIGQPIRIQALRGPVSLSKFIVAIARLSVHVLHDCLDF